MFVKSKETGKIYEMYKFDAKNQVVTIKLSRDKGGNYFLSRKFIEFEMLNKVDENKVVRTMTDHLRRSQNRKVER